MSIAASIGLASESNDLIHQNSSFSLSEQESRFIQSLAPLRVMIDDHFEPLSTFNKKTNSYQGISVDLFLHIADRLGLKYQFLHNPNLSWSKKEDLLKSNEIDLLMPVSFTEKRADGGIFTASFYDTYYGIIAKKSSNIKIKNTRDLAAYKVGVTKASAIISFIQPFIPSPQIVQYDNQADLYKSLQNSQIDVALQNKDVFQDDRFNLGFVDLILIHTILESPRRYGFYLNKTDQHKRLADIVNRYMAGVDYSKLLLKYEHRDEDLILRFAEQKHQKKLLILGIIVSITLIIFLVIAYINHRRFTVKLAENLKQLEIQKLEIQNSELKYRGLYDNSRDALIMFEPLSRTFLSGNQAAVNMFRAHNEAELLSIGFWDLSPAKQPDGRLSSEKAIEMIEIAMKDSNCFFEWTLRRISGEEFPADVLLTRIIKDEKTTLQANIRDISGRKQTEETLKRSEEKFSKAFNACPALITIVSMKDGRYIDVNDRQLSTTGYQRNEVIGKTSTELGFWLNTVDRQRYVDDLIKNGTLRNHEIRNRMRNGELRDFLVSCELIEIEGRKCSLNFMLDITDSKKTEDELTQNQLLLKTIIESATEAIYAKDAFGTYRSINGAGAQMLGYKINEVIGRTDTDLVSAETSDAFRKTDKYVMSSGQAYECEELGIENGKTFLSHKTPWRDNSGNIIGVIGVSSDISERKQSEEKLATSKTLLDAAFEQSPIPMMLVSMPDKIIRIVNTACQEILGISDEPTPIGQALVDFKPSYQNYDIEGNLTPLSKTPLALALQGHSTLRQERKIVTKKGTTHWALVSAKPIYNTKSDLIAAYLVFQDITEQKNIHNEKAKLEAELYQAQKIESIGRLAGGIAHDFNNMLTVIQGYSQMGLMESDPETLYHTYFEEINKTSYRSADLTNQLLAFARKQTIAPKVLDLNDTISGMLKMLQRLIGEDIHLAWHPAPDLWLIKADPSQIDQILANLCVNARDAIKNTGQVTIKTRNNTFNADFCQNHPDSLPGEYIHLSVSDDGSGMDQETMSHVFEPFFTSKGLGEGTGLGLATVYGIVKQNNGFITLDSELGKGTTFSIHLPRHVGEIGSKSNKDIVMQVSLGRETILLVEDDSAILKMATSTLTKQGFNVLQANSPMDAIRLVKEYDGVINLLITDVIMPVMNGKDLANKLLSLNPQLMCLYMSGYTADAISQHGVLDEGVYFIQKPFSLPDLANKVRQVLDGQLVCNRHAHVN